MIDRLSLREVASKITEQMPSVGKTVEVPVYVIHHGPGAEDYFFVFDFEEFVARTREGLFVRPRIVAWAGRRDFGQLAFSRQFRAAFGQQFDAARAQMEDEVARKGGQGWFGWLRDLWGKGLGGFASELMLLVALSAGRKALAQVGRAHLLAGKSEARQLEDVIADTQAKVDDALEAMEMRLHPQLYAHAWRRQRPGPEDGLSRDAWPLPQKVARVLGDGDV
jgi:hypothetical protein